MTSDNLCLVSSVSWMAALRPREAVLRVSYQSDRPPPSRSNSHHDVLHVRLNHYTGHHTILKHHGIKSHSLVDERVRTTRLAYHGPSSHPPTHTAAAISSQYGNPRKSPRGFQKAAPARPEKLESEWPFHHKCRGASGISNTCPVDHSQPSDGVVPAVTRPQGGGLCGIRRGRGSKTGM